MAKNKTWVFDFDGTLIDSAPGILEAYAYALRAVGIEPRVALDTRLIGPPLTETLMCLSGSDDAALMQMLTRHFKTHYDQAGVAATLAYPGIAEMLDRLSDAGVVMHISTNKRYSVTRAILDNLGWKDRFASVYALDMVEPRLPGKTQLLAKQISEQGLAVDATVYVGDKREDGDAAGANGLIFYYAAWGYGDLGPEQLAPGWNWLGHPHELRIPV